MSKKRTVYWSCKNEENYRNWNILYEEPKSLFQHLRLNQTKNKENTNIFFKCPAFINATKNIYFFVNPLHSKLEIKNNQIFTSSKTYMSSYFDHDKSIEENTLLVYGMEFYFFCEESLNMTMTSPFFSNSPHLQYGSLVPGELNIGKWFRKINLEFNLWKGVNELEILEGEPIVYFNFETDDKIVLQRFNMSKTLSEIAQTMASSTSWEPKVSLTKRYQRFLKSKTNNLVLKEIKENVF